MDNGNVQDIDQQPPIPTSDIRAAVNPHYEEMKRRRQVADNQIAHGEELNKTFEKVTNSNVPLAETQFEIEGQNFVVFTISHVGIPPITTNVSNPGLRIYGAFKTLDSATAYAKEFTEHDPACSILIAPMREWTVACSSIPMVSDVGGVNEFKQRLLERYEQNVQDRRDEFTRRLERDRSMIEEDVGGNRSSHHNVDDEPDLGWGGGEGERTAKSEDVNNPQQVGGYEYNKDVARAFERRSQNLAVISIIRDDYNDELLGKTGIAHCMFNIWACFDTQDAADTWIRNVGGDAILNHNLYIVSLYEWIFPQTQSDADMNVVYRNSEQHKLITWMSAQKNVVKQFQETQSKDKKENCPAEIEFLEH